MRVFTIEIVIAGLQVCQADFPRLGSFNTGFKVVADIDTRIMKTIDNTIVKDSRPYFQAASYYYENDKDLKQAAEWADKAIANNPKAYWIVLLKAKIQAKQKDTKGAVTTAEQVIVLATEDKNDDYVAMAKKIIAENKK